MVLHVLAGSVRFIVEICLLKSQLFLLFPGDEGSSGNIVTNEPRRQKTGLWGFRPGLTQTGLCSHRKWLET